MDSALEPMPQQQQADEASSSSSLIHHDQHQHQPHHHYATAAASSTNNNSNSLLTESSLLRWSRITSSNGIVPPPRSGAASVVACGKLFVFGGYGGGTGRLDDFWSFCFETLVWERVHVKSKQRPGCRENNGVVISGCFDRHGNNNTATIFLFGGYNGSAWLNDLWEFNIETSCWTCIQESSDPVAAVAAAAAAAVPPGDQDVSAVGRRSHNNNNNGAASSHYSSSNNSIVPSRRFGYVSVVHQGKLILWGGFDGSRWLNDMYVFDFAKKTWTEIPQDNNTNNNDCQIPSVRSCPAWAKDDNYVYIQGGYDGVERKSDFWACDLNTYTWIQMPSSRGTPPSPRYFHSCCLSRSAVENGTDADAWCLDPSGNGSNKNKLYLYGGYSGAERLADMYCYEFETQHWSRVDCTAGDAPSGRSSLVAQAHEGSLWIFGGYNGSTVLNDFYKFRLSAICVPPTRLVSDFRRLLLNASDFASDVTFRVDGKLVPAHRAILAIRSEYFRVLLCGGYMRESSSYQPSTLGSTNDNDEHDNKQYDDSTTTATKTDDPESSIQAALSSCTISDAKSKTTKNSGSPSDSAASAVAREIEIQDVSYEVFLMVLEFLYTDTVVDLTSSSSSSPLELGIHLLIASERFMLDRLKALCEDVIRKQVHVDNVMAILVASHVYNAKSLKDLTLDFILRNLQHPAVMTGLSDLRSEPDLLLEIIKRNAGNQSINNNIHHHQQQQFLHQYQPHQHAQSHRQQQQFEHYTSTTLARLHHQHHHHDTASAVNAGAGGVAAAAGANNNINNIRAGGVVHDTFDFDNGIGGGGDARQQAQGGPFGSEWNRR